MAEEKEKPSLLHLKIMAIFFVGTNLLKIIFSAVYFKQIGLSATYVGIVQSASPLSTAVGGISLGYIADRADLRKVIFTIAYLAYATTPFFVTLPQPEYQCDDRTFSLAKKTSNVSNLNNHNISEHLGNSSPWKNFSHHLVNTKENSSVLNLAMKNLSMKKVTTSVPEYISSKQYNYEVYKLDELLYPTELSNKSTTQMKLQKSANEKSLFGYVLAITIIGDFLAGASINIVDSLIVMSIDDKKLYGKIRLWGNIGQVVLIPSIALLTYFKTKDICGQSVSDFAYALYSTSLISMIGWFYALFKVHFPSSKVTEKGNHYIGEGSLKDFFTPLETWSFLINAFFYGVFGGVITSFLFWTMVNLDPREANLSIAVANFVRNGAALITYLLAPKLLHTIGYRNVLSIACVTFCGSFVVTAVMRSTWVGTVTELLASISYALSMSASVSYIGEVAHPSLAVTVQGKKKGTANIECLVTYHCWQRHALKTANFHNRTFLDN